MEINKIYCEDCLETMKQMPEGYVDLTVTSPPYDNLRDYNGYSFDFEPIAKELFRITKNGGVVVWIVNDATIKGNETGTSFRQALYFKEIGFNLHDTMIWKKISPFQHKNRYISSFEYMFIFSKGNPKTINLISDRKNKYAGEKVHGTLRQKDGSLKKPTGLKVGRTIKEYGVRLNIWEVPVEKSNKTTHPAPFSEQIAKDHILSWSNPDDLVYDPFMGSGTTAKMCILTNRKYIGSEISKKYCKIINERILTNIKKLDNFE